MSGRVGLLGARGFVGSHVRQVLQRRGAAVKALRAPRPAPGAGPLDTCRHLADLVEELADCDVVVNAAGVATAAGSGRDLEWANHRMPGLLAEVTSQSGVRLVHVSSAAVQGRRPVLDSSTEHEPFSPYSASKAAGERAVLSHPGESCIYRPPGVHGPDRAATRTLARLARGPLAAVARPGRQNSPQALIENVADAVAFLAMTGGKLPRIVHHPSEGLTVSSLLHLLGGRPPRQVPRPVASAAVTGAFLAARARPGLEGHARRLEMLLVGQEQAPSWLTTAGWQAPYGTSRWRELGQALAVEAEAGRR